MERSKKMSIKSAQSTIRPMYYILLVLTLFLIGWIGGWSQAIKRGNAHYKTEAYDAALEAYQSAAENRLEDAISHYNLGTAYTKKNGLRKQPMNSDGHLTQQIQSVGHRDTTIWGTLRSNSMI